MWHPSHEVTVVDFANGLDRRLYGFRWYEDNSSGVGFIGHFYNYGSRGALLGQASIGLQDNVTSGFLVKSQLK